MRKFLSVVLALNKEELSIDGEIYRSDGGADCGTVSNEENILLKVSSQQQKDRKR